MTDSSRDDYGWGGVRRGDGGGGGSSVVRQPLFVASAVFVVLVAVLAVWLVIAGDDPVRSGPPGSGGPVPAPRAAAGGCRPTDTDQRVPASPPAGVQWTLHNTIAVPVSRAAGPLVPKGGVSANPPTPTDVAPRTASNAREARSPIRAAGETATNCHHGDDRRRGCRPPFRRGPMTASWRDRQGGTRRTRDHLKEGRRRVTAAVESSP